MIRRKLQTITLILGIALGIGGCAGYFYFNRHNPTVSVNINNKMVKVSKNEIKTKVLKKETTKLAVTEILNEPKMEPVKKVVDLSKEPEIIMDNMAEQMYVNNIGLEEIKKKKAVSKNALIVCMINLNKEGIEVNRYDKVIFEEDKDYAIFSGQAIGKLSKKIESEIGSYQFYIIKDSKTDKLLMSNLNAELEITMLKEQLNEDINNKISSY